MPQDSITFRPETDDDIPLLKRIYFSTREHEMALLVDWTDEEKNSFLEQQFHAQHSYYHEMFPDARYDLILHEGQPVGRLYLDRREDEHRVIDIALLTEHRGGGMGGKIMRDILAEATSAGKQVTIHVEKNNQAMHLYDRLGFKKIEDQGVYWLMQWQPGESSSS